MFGNRDRLEVLVAIARSPDGFVNATELQREIGMVQTRVRSQLLALSEVGLLTAFPTSSDVRHWYKRNDSPLWDTSLDLYDDWVS